MGALFGLTPFQSYFIDYLKCDIPVENVTDLIKVNRVVGIRTTLCKLIETIGRDIFLPCIYYHLTQKDVNLFSPQTYHKIHVGNSVVHWNQVIMHFPFHRVHIPVDLGGEILPVVHN